MSKELITANNNKRLINWLVDTIFIGLIAYSLAELVGSNIVAFFPAVFFLYYFLFEYAFSRTPGKCLTGTKVINFDLQKPTVKQLLWRTLIRLFALDIISFHGFNPIGWHDRLSQTLVVDNQIQYKKSTGPIEQEKISVEEFERRSAVVRGAYWFYWIGVLSWINILLYISNSGVRFIAGLGISDVLFLSNPVTSQTVNFLLWLLFFTLAHYASKGKSWAFIVGMTLYTLDSLLLVAVQDWLSVAFHAFALYQIYAGYKANQKSPELSKV